MSNKTTKTPEQTTLTAPVAPVAPVAVAPVAPVAKPLTASEQMKVLQDQIKALQDQAKGIADVARKENEEKTAAQKALFATIEQDIRGNLPPFFSSEISEIRIRKGATDWEIVISNGHKHTGTGTGVGSGNGIRTVLEIGRVVIRKHKDQVYTLTVTDKGNQVCRGVEDIGTFKSLTAAAEFILNKQGGVNGKAWWQIA
jgi:hypothetical protein